MMSIEWAKLVATELLVIRMSRPFVAESTANWVMNSVFTWRLLSADARLGIILGLINTDGY